MYCVTNDDICLHTVVLCYGISVSIFAMELLVKETAILDPGHCNAVSLKVVFPLKLQDSSSNVSLINVYKSTCAQVTLFEISVTCHIQSIN